ncbi:MULTISPECIES: glycerophosphoryl diester phosphodiesterase membrane domain-containing protein [unclassified Carboxylicivirga]|uniref:glycerophosphoryl diester phosphodiesterase membrane domain-containing protein n=1 Tax=Carboxylicivirga TaxID=1628153 RepID=UPI003D332BB2
MTQLKFAQRRDFSGVINAAMEFFKQEGLFFIKAMLTYTGIPVIAMIASLAYMVLQFINGGFESITNSPDPMAIINFFIPLFIFLLLAIAVQIVIVGASYGYMKEYHEKGAGNFTISDVGHHITRRFFPVIGYGIVITILMMIGFAFFILPGIYLAITLSLIFPVMFIENKGLGQNLSRCFQLIKNNWWITFAILLVASLLVGFVSSIISVPLQIYMQLKIPTLIQSGDWAQLNAAFVITSYILLLVLSIYLKAFVYVVTGIQYFNLSEKDNASTLLDRINEIGTSDAEVKHE